MSRLNLLVAQFSQGYTDGLYGKIVGSHQQPARVQGGKAYATGWEYGDVDRQRKLDQALANADAQNNVLKSTTEEQ